MILRFPTDRRVNVYEVGAGPLHTVQTRALWSRREWSFTLVEPNPLIYAELAMGIRAYPNVTLLGLACGAREGFHDLLLAADRSCLVGTSSPLQAIYRQRAEELWGAFRVPVYTVPFGQLDPGDIDLLYLTVEGAEPFVFSQLHSRPAVIVFPHYMNNDYGYSLKNWDGVKDWLVNNDYQCLEEDERYVRFLRTSAVGKIVDGETFLRVGLDSA